MAKFYLFIKNLLFVYKMFIFLFYNIHVTGKPLALFFGEVFFISQIKKKTWINRVFF